MNTRHTPPGGRKPVAKPLGGKPLGGRPVGGETASGKLAAAKPREQQEKSKQRKAIAEATGAPKREEAMLAAVSHARLIGSNSEPARHMLSAAFESIERSVKAAGLGTVAVNRKIIDIARTNIVSSFDLARALAGARTPLEAARLNMAFFDERMRALATQAEELRALQAELVTKASTPLREHMLRGRGLVPPMRGGAA
jgi:hypothetical protein